MNNEQQNWEQTQDHTTAQGVPEEQTQAFEQEKPTEQKYSRFQISLVVVIAVMVMAAAGFYFSWF